MANIFQRIIVSCFIMATFASRLQAVQDEPVLVWRLKAMGVEQELADKIRGLLGKEIDHIQGIRLIGQREISAAIEHKPQLAQCDAQVECLAELGAEVKANKVIAGVLGRLGETFSLDMKVVDVKNIKQSSRLAQTWDGGDETLIEVVRQVATRALRPSAYRGEVILLVNIPKVKIFIDGDFIGQSPLNKPLSLVPGRHALKLARKNYKDIERFIDVRFERTIKVSFTLKEAAMSEIIAIQKAHRWWSVGLRAGLMVNVEGFWAPELNLELNLRLPWLDGIFSLVAESGVLGQRFSDQATDLSVDGELLAWLNTLGLQIHIWPRWPLTPFLDTGLGMALVWSSIEPEGFDKQQARQSRFIFYAGAGLEIHMGPGALFTEVRYQYMTLNPSGSGGITGSFGAVSTGLGYRLVF